MTSIPVELLGIIATLATAVAYAVKKYTDMKTKQAEHEMQLQDQKFKHQTEIELIRQKREDTRAIRDQQTTQYISENTSTLRALTKSVESLQEALQKEIGNGITGTVRQLVQQGAQLERKVDDLSRDMCDVRAAMKLAIEDGNETKKSLEAGP